MNKLFCLLSVLLPSACYRREIKVQAVRDVPACRDSNAAYSRADFIVPKNSICYLGRKVYGKAGRFTAIRRTEGLEDWMIEDSAFQPVK
nr:DNA mismatch repair protein MutS [uncultured Neisseria sp.]